MDKQQRGLLLVEQEETAAKISELNTKLRNYGRKLSTFANALSNTPESVKFSNAPSNLGSFPPELMGGSSFNWDELPDKETVARLIQELRAAQQNLKEIQRQLQNK